MEGIGSIYFRLSGYSIYDKLGKQPVLAVEVDGYAYHNRNKKQEQRDKLKDEILHKYNIPIA